MSARAAMVLLAATLAGCSLVVDGDYTSGGSTDGGMDGAVMDAGDPGDDAGDDDGGGDDAGRDAAVDSGPPTLEQRCEAEYGEVRVLTSPTEFLNEIPRLFGSATSAADRIVTGNYRYGAGDLFLEADTIPPPDDMACQTSTCTVPRVVKGTIPGIVEVTSLNRVVIENGAVFRMRFWIEFFPTGPAAFVQFEPPCGETCERTDLLCDRDLACYPSGEEYCFDCEARPAADCACEGVAEGEMCSWRESDLFYIGTCMGGTCVRM